MFNTHEGKNVRKGKNETVYIFFQGSTPPRLLSPHVSSWWRVLNGPPLLDGYFIDVHVRACCSFLLQLCLMVLQYCCNEALRTAEGSSQRQREGDVGANVDSHSQRGVAHPTRYPSPLPQSSSLMSPPEVLLARERAELQITLQVTPGEKSYHTGHTNRCEARPSNDAVDTWSECVPVSDCAKVHGEESTETYLTKYWTYFTKNCLRRLFSSFVLSYSSRT